MTNGKENKDPLEIRNSKLGIGAGSDHQWLSMSEAALFVPYSAEYLSLLARKGKLVSKKIGNTWYTTRTGLEDYMKRQMIRSHVQNGNYQAAANFVPSAVNLTPKKFLDDEIKLRQVRSFKGDTDEYLNRSGIFVEPISEKSKEKVTRPLEGEASFVPSVPEIPKVSPVKEIEHMFERVLEKRAVGKKFLSKSRVHYKAVFSSRMLVAALILCLISFTVFPIPVVFSFF